MVDGRVFQFCSVGYLEKLTGKRAHNLNELTKLIASCSDSSIFYHTFSALRKMRGSHAPYTNDFAIWISRCLSDEPLSEKLDAINLREYSTIEALRARIVQIIEAYRHQSPAAFQRQADEPFYLCDVVKIVYLTDKFAYDLNSFRQIFDKVSDDSVYYHFVESRVQNEFHLDDFSIWIEQSLSLVELAENIRNIDINVVGLSDIRNKIGILIDGFIDEYRKIV